MVAKGLEDGIDVKEITGIKKIDDLTCTVIVDGVDMNAKRTLGLESVLSKSYYGEGFEKGKLETVKAKNDVPMGSEPYVFKSNKDNVVRLDAGVYYNLFDNNEYSYIAISARRVPDKALECFKKAGYEQKNGKLVKMGAKLNITDVNFSILLNRVNNDDIDMWCMGWVTYMPLHQKKNMIAYSSNINVGTTLQLQKLQSKNANFQGRYQLNIYDIDTPIYLAIVLLTNDSDTNKSEFQCYDAYHKILEKGNWSMDKKGFIILSVDGKNIAILFINNGAYYFTDQSLEVKEVSKIEDVAIVVEN